MLLPFNRASSLLFAPEIPEGKTGVVEPLSKDDIVDFLKDDDTEDDGDKSVKDKEADKEDKTKGKSKSDDKDEDEEDDLSDIEEELEEPSEDKLELTTPVRRKEILAKYPKLFKEFPYLEKAYYREQAFTEIFPTPAEAKDAAEGVGILENLNADLSRGDTEKILLAAKSDKKGFAKLVDNYLPTLAKVDEAAYLHIVGNLTRHTIIAMANAAKEEGNDDLLEAAKILNKFVFRTEKFSNPSNLSQVDKDDKSSDEEGNLKRERDDFNRQRFESANEDLNSRVNNAYKATIDAHIDPKQSMTTYVKKHACSEALNELNSLMEKDSRFKVIKDKLWEKAIASNFSKSSIDAIRSAFVSRAKTLLPSVIKKAREDALRGMTVKAKNDDRDIVHDTRPRARSNDDNEQPRSKSKSGKVPSDMSSLEYLMSDD